MKAFKYKILAATLVFLTTSIGLHAEDKASKEEPPKTILIKKDQDGNLFVHRSNSLLSKIDKKRANDLDKLKFEEVSDLSEVLDLDKVTSATEELDRDKPRQSWYVYWGYYPYYPIYYYSYTYYPYHFYSWRGCNYYWYRPGATPYYY